MDIIRQLEDEQLREEALDFSVGDTIRVDYKIKEGERERIQAFEGTVIKIQGGGCRQTFTVRRIAYGVGVERTFPMHSVRVENVKVVRRGQTKKSKLYYLRERQGKSARIKERKDY